jgi:hypothetical protein
VPRAGVNTAEQVAFGAELADETGIGSATPVPLAERQDVKAPAPSEHVDDIGNPPHCMATVATADLSDALRDALEGRSTADATTARFTTLPSYRAEHPRRS